MLGRSRNAVSQTAQHRCDIFLELCGPVAKLRQFFNALCSSLRLILCIKVIQLLTRQR